MVFLSGCVLAWPGLQDRNSCYCYCYYKPRGALYNVRVYVLFYRKPLLLFWVTWSWDVFIGLKWKLIAVWLTAATATWSAVGKSLARFSIPLPLPLSSRSLYHWLTRMFCRKLINILRTRAHPTALLYPIPIEVIDGLKWVL